MTDCSFCLTEGIRDSVSAGPCGMCGREVCTYPGTRSDAAFHGEACECTCGRVICKHDFPRHSRGHGPGRAPSTCFPMATSISATGILAIIEEHASAASGQALPGKQSDHIHDFLTHVAATIDYVHAGIRHLDGTPTGVMPASEIPTRLAEILQEPLRRLLLAPIAFNNLRVAWTHASPTSRVRERYSHLARRIDRMSDALNAIRPLRDPMSAGAVSAYAELSPRIAERLTDVRSLTLPKFRSPLDLHPFFAVNMPDLQPPAPHLSLIEPTLSAYLPSGR